MILTERLAAFPLVPGSKFGHLVLETGDSVQAGRLHVSATTIFELEMYAVEKHTICRAKNTVRLGIFDFYSGVF